MSSLSIVEVLVRVEAFSALVDTSGMMSLVTPGVTKKKVWKGLSSVWVADGSEIGCKGSGNMKIAVWHTTLRLQVIAVDRAGDGIFKVMGMNAINCFGSVSVGGDVVSFCSAGSSCTVSLQHEREQSSLRD